MPNATVLAHVDQHGRAQMPTPRSRRYMGPRSLATVFVPSFCSARSIPAWRFSCGCQSDRPRRACAVPRRCLGRKGTARSRTPNGASHASAPSCRCPATRSPTGGSSPRSRSAWASATPSPIAPPPTSFWEHAALSAFENDGARATRWPRTYRGEIVGRASPAAPMRKRAFVASWSHETLYGYLPAVITGFLPDRGPELDGRLRPCDERAPDGRKPSGGGHTRVVEMSTEQVAQHGPALYHLREGFVRCIPQR